MREKGRGEEKVGAGVVERTESRGEEGKKWKEGKEWRDASLYMNCRWTSK